MKAGLLIPGLVLAMLQVPDLLPWIHSGLDRLPWSPWRTGAGEVIEAELEHYRWDDRTLVLEIEGSERARAVPAEQLDFWSKVRLLTSEPFHHTITAHRAELQKLPAYRDRMDQLSRFSVVALTVYVAAFISVSWFLAMWLLRSASLFAWFQCALAFLASSALGVAGVAWMLEAFGRHQLLEYVVVVASAHTVLFVMFVWWTYRSTLMRSAWWYVFNWVAALLLPATLFLTGISAQVYSHYRQLNLQTFDAYLSEFWLRPMGLI